MDLDLEFPQGAEDVFLENAYFVDLIMKLTDKN